MTLAEASTSLRRLADAFDRLRQSQGDCPLPSKVLPVLSEEAAIGAASFLCYLRDCLTASPKEQWSRGELLVLLETCSRDGELFPMGVGSLMWEMETTDE